MYYQRTPLSQEEKQSIRIKRGLLAAGVSVSIIALMWVAFALRLIELTPLIRITLLTLGCVVALMWLFISGFNLKLPDPRVATLPLVCAALIISFASYHLDAIRGTMALLYMLILAFAAFNLSRIKLLLIGSFIMMCSIGVLVASLINKPAAVTLHAELFHQLTLALVMGWFSFIVGYVNDLQRQLRATNKALLIAYEEAEKYATFDELTGLFNRRHITNLLVQEQQRLARGGGPCSICVFDLDYFKRLNDTHGHLAGDKVLQSFASTVAASLRKIDAFGRFGGEEFLLILPETNLVGARAMADRIRESIESYRFPALPPEFRQTVSAGVTELDVNDDLNSLLGRADSALYKAKAAGRNCVMSIDNTEYVLEKAGGFNTAPVKQESDPGDAEMLPQP